MTNDTANTTPPATVYAVLEEDLDNVETTVIAVFTSNRAALDRLDAIAKETAEECGSEIDDDTGEFTSRDELHTYRTVQIDGNFVYTVVDTQFFG